jgi:lipoprotein-anchoring transpeptidase ErfK/SrfK
MFFYPLKLSRPLSPKKLIYSILAILWLNIYSSNAYSNQKADITILVSVSQQKLYLIEKGDIVKSFPVSTSAYGVGNQKGSNKTPLGLHQIKYKVGYNAPFGQIFRATRNTGEIAKIHTDKTDLEEDLIVTRILWLEGLEEGLNKGGNQDSFNRHIYIHGTNEEGLIGKPASHGCIRMLNKDIITLFDKVTHYDQVLIVE